MDLTFYIWFGVCFTCFMLRTTFNIVLHKKSELAENKKIYTAISIIMFFLWFSWFPMNLWDPFKITLPTWAVYSGLMLFIAGILLVVLSHIKIKGFGNMKHLVKTGIYSKIRNPMYLGFILWLIGFPIFMQSIATLASAAIWVPLIMYWKILEEKELEKEHPGYSEYKKKTWF